MTLGKNERFWETIWHEFLSRAQFDSFDAARERIKLWIKYYNHKRPHQGIEGLCPADRFFEIQTQLRKTIENGIQENLLELALRGKPQAPFYMVGRMDGQSVVLRAEKGKLKLSVTDQQNKEQELTYDLNKNDSDERENGKEEEASLSVSQCPGQSSGGAGGVDGAVQTGGSLPPVEHQLDHLQPVATAGDGRDASGVGEPGQPGQGRSLEPEVAVLAPAPAANDDGKSIDQPVGANKQDCQPAVPSGKNGVDEACDHQNQSPTAGGTDLQSPQRPDDGHGGGTDTGHQPPAVLPVGTTSAPSLACGVGEPFQRTPERENGPGQTIIATPGGSASDTGAAL